MADWFGRLMERDGRAAWFAVAVLFTAVAVTVFTEGVGAYESEACRTEQGAAGSRVAGPDVCDREGR